MSATQPVVQATHVSLAYRRSRHRVPSLKAAAIDAVKRRIEFHEWLALDDVSFEVEAGEVLAVIGRNGAGKSTLLKIIARVLPPTRGRIVVRGQVAPLIELGAGFNYELTAAENIVLYSTILGRDPKVARARIPDIAAWAGLEEHLDVPLRTYSSGMAARLGFAVATDHVPELLLMDEVLSVGDADFHERSSQRTRDLIHSGAAVVLVTHDLSAAKRLATKGLWLDRGHVKAAGHIDDVIAAYRNDIHH